MKKVLASQVNHDYYEMKRVSLGVREEKIDIGSPHTTGLRERRTGSLASLALIGRHGVR
jgi:hypothetical protein